MTVLLECLILMQLLIVLDRWCSSVVNHYLPVPTLLTNYTRQMLTASRGEPEKACMDARGIHGMERWARDSGYTSLRILTLRRVMH